MKNHQPKYEPTERLKSVLAVGGTEALFPFLKDWSTEELKALLNDVDAHHTFLEAVTDAAWQETAIRSEFFFNRAASAELDKQHRRMKVEILGMCSEICSVAIYYLGERGEDDGIDEDEEQVRPEQE